MRIKDKSALTLKQLPLRNGLPAGLDLAGAADPPIPYRLVPPSLGPTSVGAPPVLTAIDNRDGPTPQKAGAGAAHGRPSLPPPFAPAQRQGSAPAAGASGGEDTAGGAATGRPQRKRRQPASAEDMVPSDLLTRRKPRLPLPQLPPPPPSRPFNMLPVTAALAAAHAAQAGAEAPRQMPAAIQLVTMPAPGGGTMTGLAIPPAALLAMPGLLQQHLRAAGAGGTALQLPPSMLPMLGKPPYRLVPAAQPSRSQELPAVKVAAPKEVVHLARQAEEEERRRALAEADARVMVRLGQAGQAAGRAQGKGAKPGGPRAPAARGQARGGLVGGNAVAGPRQRSLLPARAAGPPPGTWHPGFQCLDGVTHVNVAQAAAAPRLPAVVVGLPPRMSHPPTPDLEEKYDFSDDPLLASLEYLRHAARTAGSMPAGNPATQTLAQAKQLLHRERLGRAHYARDGRRFGKEVPQPTRKSVRLRVPPQALARNVDADARGGSAGPPAPQRRRAVRGPQDATDVRRGRQFQAQLPALRPRPPQPTVEEARWGGQLVCRGGEVAPPRVDARQAASMPAASPGERQLRGDGFPLPLAQPWCSAAWVADAHAALVAAMGAQRAEAAGLLAMGAAACADLLSGEEQAAVEAGMREHGRAFRRIRDERVPSRSVLDLQNFYYNVWKLRATPASAAWYEERAAEEVAREEQQGRLEQQAAAEAEAQRQRQDERQKQRMLREVLQWLKVAARTPAEAQNRPVVVQRAQRAAKLIGGLDAAAQRTLPAGL